MIKERKGRIVMPDGQYDDCCPSTYHCIHFAISLSLLYEGKFKVQEQHGTRWFTIMEVTNGKIKHTSKKKDYYILPTDQYGQPSGYVETRPMTRAEAIEMSVHQGFVFESYIAACYRAMD